MRHIRISFLVVAISVMMAGMAFAIDVPDISTWTQNMGVGGGGPGRGDVLIAPYYDVRALIDPRLPGAAATTAQTQYTLFSIVNTDRTYGVIARLRFREWKRSRECLDLDIPLTTNDVWVGQLSRLAAGGVNLSTPVGGGERWISAERVDLPAPGYFAASLFPVTGFDFRTFDIETEETNPLPRCEYGYIEIFGEESVAAPITTAEPWRFPRVTIDAGNAGCAGAACWGFGRDVRDVLMGSVYLLRPTQAISHMYNMTALSDFAVDNLGIWASTSTAYPHFFFSVQGGPGQLGTNPGVGGFNQLEGILSKRWFLGEYVTGTDPADTSATPTTTSWVITFPTKHFHYDRTNASRHEAGVGTASLTGPPFTGLRETLNDHLVAPALTACQVGENVTFRVYDRKENTFAPGEPVSPPQLIPPGKIPYEVNIIGYYPAARPPDPPYFRDNITVATASGSVTFYAGYVNLDMSVPSLLGKDAVVFNFFGNIFQSYNGLPSIDLQLQEFFNGAVNGYYGNTVPLRYGADWFTGTPAPVPVLN